MSQSHIDKIRILQILWDDDFGGVERHVLDLVMNLDRSVFSCEICILHNDGNRITKGLRENGIPIHCMNLKSGFDFLGALRFIKFVRRKGYDIIHSQVYPLWIQLAVGLLSGCINVVRSYGRDVLAAYTLRSILMNRISRFVTDGYIAPSEVQKRTMVNLYHIRPEKIHVVYHGIDFSRYRPPIQSERAEKRRELGIDEGDFAIGTVGRLADQKNYPCFIRSALRIHKEMPNTKFFIVGCGKLEDRLRAMVHENGAEEYIILLGPRTDVPELLRAWDVFLFTTWVESFGLVVLEAMANELPVVLTDSSSLPEVVGNTGILVKPDDDESFAKAVLALLKDEDRRKKMAKEANERARSLFSMKRMIDKMSKIYKKLIADKTGDFITSQQ